MSGQYCWFLGIMGFVDSKKNIKFYASVCRHTPPTFLLLLF